MSKVNITINDVAYSVNEGITILEAARENDIYIPTLCHFKGIDPRANCRMCIVEVEGMRTFQPSCATKVREGMVVRTDTDRIRAARKTTLELILSHHAVDCHHCMRIGSSTEQSLDPRFCEMCFFCDCVRDGICELQALAREYHVDKLPYEIHDAEYTEDTSIEIVRNPNKCIKCRRCVDVCKDVQTVHNLSVANRGYGMTVVPEMGKSMADSSCVHCGHCADVCPTGAIYLREHIDEVLYAAHSYKEDTVVQISEDVLPEITRMYKLNEGDISMEQIKRALHKVGFKHVILDDEAVIESGNQGAAIIEENIGNGPVVLTNSPAVVNFVDRFFPGMKDVVKVYDNPQTIFGKQAVRFQGDKPIRTVNITPSRELAVQAAETGNVDYVLNERELYRLFIRTGGAPARKNPEKFESVEGSCKYETILGPVTWNLEDDPTVVDVEIGGKMRSCAVAHNLGQVRMLMEQLKNGTCKYDVVRLCS